MGKARCLFVPDDILERNCPNPMTEVVLSDHDFYILNACGIASGAVSLAAAVVVTATALLFRCKVPKTFQSSFNSFPTKILYLTLAISILYSVCYIWSSLPSAQNHAVCQFTIVGIVLFLHLMNSTTLLILLHCSLLVSKRDHNSALRITRIVTTVSVLASFGLAFAGLFAGLYQFSEDQQTCWIYAPHANETATVPKRLYGYESAFLYGPVFLGLLLSISMLLYIAWRLQVLRRGPVNKGFQSMIIRLGASPAFLALHCLMIVGGDLPISYHTQSAMFASTLFSFLGYGTFGICFAICVLFVDPAFFTCWRALLNRGPKSEVRLNSNSAQACGNISSNGEEMSMTEDLEPVLYKRPLQEITKV